MVWIGTVINESSGKVHRNFLIRATNEMMACGKFEYMNACLKKDNEEPLRYNNEIKRLKTVKNKT